MERSRLPGLPEYPLLAEALEKPPFGPLVTQLDRLVHEVDERKGRVELAKRRRVLAPLRP